MKDQTTEKELYTSLDTSEDKTVNEELVTRIDVEDSPFVIIGTDRGYFVSLGEFRLSDTFKTEEEAWDDAVSMTWNRMIQVVMVLLDKREQLEQIINDTKKVKDAS